MLSNLGQQALFRRSWGGTTRRMVLEKMSPTLRVIGRVTGTISISDLGKNIGYNQIVDFNEGEINRSRDLQNAIKMKWVDVLENRSMLQRAVSIPAEPKNEMDKEEILKLAKEMAKVMAQEMVKGNLVVGELKQEIMDLKKTINDREDRVIIQQLPQSFEKQQIKIDEMNSNIFIDVNDQDMHLKSNIKEIGTVKEEKVDLTDSLERMKRFRRKP